MSFADAVARLAGHEDDGRPFASGLLAGPEAADAGAMLGQMRADYDALVTRRQARRDRNAGRKAMAWDAYQRARQAAGLADSGLSPVIAALFGPDLDEPPGIF